MKTFDRLNPLTGEVATTAHAMSVDEVRAIATAAEAAFPAWSKKGPSERRDLLYKAAAALRSKAKALATGMMDETGATRTWGLFNVTLAANMLREAASMTTQITGDVIPSDRPGCVAMTMREPVGVVLGIAPWNGPVILGARAVAWPLACGNTVILKASETCPRTHQLLAECFADAGFPENVVTCVTNAPEDAGEVVGALIDHPAVKRITFTGSTNVGRIVAKRAAEHLKPVLLELGGKAPFLVLEDADLTEAVRAAAFGAFMHQGQICMSTERIIVVDSIADEFIAKFRVKAETLTAGDPAEGDAPLGALIDQRAVDRAEALVEDALTQGAERLCGGPADGLLMAATVVDRVTPEMRLFREETFAPVVAITRAKDEAEAIRLANDSEFGLTASVFTRDMARGLRVARQIRSGMCHINGPTVQDEPQMPFGGVGASGYGRFGGKAGLDFFTELRWVTMQTLPGHYPI